MGGLVHVDQQALAAERDHQQSLLASLRLDHETAKLDLKGFMDEEEELRNTLTNLQKNLADHIVLMENAWSRRYISVAVGLELTIKRLRIELAVRFRDINQRAKTLIDKIKTAHEKLSVIEFNIFRTEQRLRAIEARLRPVGNLGDALNVNGV